VLDDERGTRVSLLERTLAAVFLSEIETGIENRRGTPTP
jgi:hypothetical protein